MAWVHSADRLGTQNRLGTQYVDIAPNSDQGEFTHHWTATSCPHDLRPI